MPMFISSTNPAFSSAWLLYKVQELISGMSIEHHVGGQCHFLASLPGGVESGTMCPSEGVTRPGLTHPIRALPQVEADTREELSCQLQTDLRRPASNLA